MFKVDKLTDFDSVYKEDILHAGMKQTKQVLVRVRIWLNLIGFRTLWRILKGTPEELRCGFSVKAVEILRMEGLEFGSFNILTDKETREGLKTYSNWSSFPQLYIKGEFMGGSDIMLEMQKRVEFKGRRSELGYFDILSDKKALQGCIQHLQASNSSISSTIGIISSSSNRW